MNKKYLVLSGGVFCFFFLLLTPLGLFNDWIPPLTQTGYYFATQIDPGDDTGYYAYLRSGFFDGDFDFINERNYAHVEKFTPTGYVFNNWQIGQSILFLPFFLLGHFVALIYNKLGYAVSVDGYSPPYYLATALASQTYLFAGLLFLFNIVRERFRPFIAWTAVMAIWLGSPLIYYTFIRQRMAHTAEFFLAAVFLWFWLKERTSEDNYKHAIMGGILGFLCMVRLLDVAFLALYLADQIFLVQSRKNLPLSRKVKILFVRAGCFGGFFVLMLLPQFLAWHQLNGVSLPARHIAFAERGLAAFSLSPFLVKLLSLFLSTRWGLMLAAPVMVLGLIGTFLGNGISRQLRFGFGVYLSFLFLMIILYPEDAASYSQRHLISSLPVLALGLAAVLSKCARYRWLGGAAIAFVGVCIAGQYFMLIQYKVTIIYNDPQFALKALSRIPSVLLNHSESLLRSSNFFKLLFLDHPKTWNYQDVLFLILFPLAQMICVALVVLAWRRPSKTKENRTEIFQSRHIAGGLVLAPLLLALLVGTLAPDKTPKEITNRKIAAALIAQGDLSLQKGQADRALALFKRASELLPELWTTYYKIGVVYETKKLLLEANKNYRKVLSLEPNQVFTLFNLGDNLLALGDLKQAEKYLTASMRILPTDKAVYNSLGRLYAFQKKLEASREMFQAAIARDPQFSEAHANLAVVSAMIEDSKK
ncbi:MAG: tetratricopeptide repeat protein [Nitrospinales bacterium]